MVRLFVGGLPAQVTPQDLEQRFSSFGRVSSCELPLSKPFPNEQPSSNRGFAYVELQPTNEGALRRCISTYNGCKWMGETLRVEVAKQSMLARVEEERCQGRAAAVKLEAAACCDSLPGQQRSAEAPAPLTLSDPSGKVFVASPGKKRKLFPPSAPLPKEALDWAPAELSAAADQAGRPVAASMQQKQKPSKKRSTVNAVYAEAASMQELGEDLKFVDFMTEEEVERGEAPTKAHGYHSSDSDCEEDRVDGTEVLLPGAGQRAHDGGAQLERDEIVAVVTHACKQAAAIGKSSVQLPEGVISALLAEFERADQDGDSDSSMSDLDERQWERQCRQAEKRNRLAVA